MGAIIQGRQLFQIYISSKRGQLIEGRLLFGEIRYFQVVLYAFLIFCKMEILKFEFFF